MDGFLPGKPVLLPEINCRGLFFNEDLHLCEDPETDAPPHVWALFGGRDGSLLSSLTGLRLTLSGKSKLSMIEFFYCNQAEAQKTKFAVQTVVLDLSPIPIQRNFCASCYTLDIDGPAAKESTRLSFHILKTANDDVAVGNPPISLR